MVLVFLFCFFVFLSSVWCFVLSSVSKNTLVVMFCFVLCCVCVFVFGVLSCFVFYPNTPETKTHSCDSSETDGSV